MAYFKINDIDFSMYVNALKVNSNVNYTAQTNAAGDSIVDYVNKKRVLEVGIIPLTSEAMANLQAALDGFNVSISFRNPLTNELEEGLNCIIPSSSVEYQTIRADKVMYKAFTFQVIEL